MWHRLPLPYHPDAMIGIQWSKKTAKVMFGYRLQCKQTYDAAKEHRKRVNRAPIHHKPLAQLTFPSVFPQSKAVKRIM